MRLRVDQVAERLNVSPPFMYKLFKTGRLRFFNIGRRTLITQSALEQFIEKQTEATSPAAQV